MNNFPSLLYRCFEKTPTIWTLQLCDKTQNYSQANAKQKNGNEVP